MALRLVGSLVGSVPLPRVSHCRFEFTLKRVYHYLTVDQVMLHLLCKHDGRIVFVRLADHVFHLVQYFIFILHFIMLHLGRVDVILIELCCKFRFIDCR